MRKLIFLFVMLLGLTAGCTSDDIIGRTDTADSTAVDGYLRMSINLPSAPSSRAANDDFHNGLPSEYSINSAVLIILEGDTDDEMKARFHSAYEIDLDPSLPSANPSQVTVTAQLRQNILNSDTDFRSKHHFAFLVLNAKHLVQVSADHKKISFCGQLFDVATNKITFGDLMKYTVDQTQYSLYSPQNGFVMLNAPLADKPGGASSPDGAKVHWLADITGQIYDTEQQAKSHPATQIYVERMVAKVTMPQNQHGTLKSKELEIEDASGVSTVSLPWKLVGWKLDNTNNVTYIERNVSTDWNGLKTNSSSPAKPYRFIGDTPLAPDTSLYRTYWAIDPNYADDGRNHVDDLYKAYNDTKYNNGWGFPSAEDNPVSTTDNPYPMGFGDNWPQYCLENTFDVANQTQEQTTRILAKVQIGDGKTDYYVVNDDNTHLYTLEGLNKKFQLVDKIKEFLVNDETAQESYQDFFDWAGDPDIDPAELTKDNIKLSLHYRDDENKMNGETYVVADIVIPSDPGAGQTLNFTYEGNPDNLSLILGQELTLKKYTNGISYYPIRIKHFGDDLTPWNKDESAEVKPGNIYPNDTNRDNNYLGRYGVVRNNWYNVSINSIYGIGSPISPPPSETPDDEISNYISVSINLLPWTLRGQGADL